MGLGVEGPIGDLAAFAISRAFRVLSTRTNHGRAKCKGCGAELGRCEGREVRVEGQRPGQAAYPYFCPACFRVVWDANVRFPSLEPGELASLEQGEARPDAGQGAGGAGGSGVEVDAEGRLERQIRAREREQQERERERERQIRERGGVE